MTWVIRPAEPGDLAGIMAIETSEFLNDAWSESLMAAELDSAHTEYFAAHREEEPGILCGYAGLFAPRGGTEGDVQTIAVARDARRGGLGRALMKMLLATAAERGVRELFLEVREDNEGARRLYRELHFEELGTRAGYYQPDNVDAVVMRRSLLPAQEHGIGR